jgi:hypothetical protein
MDMDLASLRKRVGKLARERYALERLLLGTLSRKELLPGSLVEKYKACNKPGCKCLKGELHGPFLYLSLNERGKTKMVFIPRGLWHKTRDRAERYRRWRRARARMVKINSEILRLLDEMEHQVSISYEDLKAGLKR